MKISQMFIKFCGREVIIRVFSPEPQTVRSGNIV